MHWQHWKISVYNISCLTNFSISGAELINHHIIDIVCHHMSLDVEQC